MWLLPYINAICFVVVFLFVFTCSDCPWSRGSHVPQADVRGASSHLPSDPWPHRVRCYWCRRSFLQVLRQRHYRAHQVWQVRFNKEVQSSKFPLQFSESYLHGGQCEQRNWSIITSLYPSASIPSLTQALGSYEVCQLSRHSQSVLYLWPFEIWTLTFSKLILTSCSFLFIWEFVLTTHDTEDVLLSAGWICWG